MKNFLLGSLVAILATSAAVASLAQVFPVRWDESEPLASAVAAGAVAIGDGGVSLNPDISFALSAGGTGAPQARSIEDSSCSAANRGEIRLMVLTHSVVDRDALCFCRQNLLDPSGTALATYRWVCLFT